MKSEISAKTYLEQVIWLVATVFEMLLILRILLKLMEADVTSYFTKYIYGVTGLLHFPFKSVADSLEYSGIVFEPTVILAMVVYWMLAIAAAKVIAVVEAGSRSRQFEKRALECERAIKNNPIWAEKQ